MHPRDRRRNKRQALREPAHSKRMSGYAGLVEKCARTGLFLGARLWD